jgi:hypothetical protein
MPDNPTSDSSNLSDREAPLAPRQPEPANPTPRLADVRDPADEIPVPVAMSPAEIDERAQAVEAVRDNRDLEPRTEV